MYLNCTMYLLAVRAVIVDIPYLVPGKKVLPVKQYYFLKKVFLIIIIIIAILANTPMISIGCDQSAAFIASANIEIPFLY